MHIYSRMLLWLYCLYVEFLFAWQYSDYGQHDNLHDTQGQYVQDTSYVFACEHDQHMGNSKSNSKRKDNEFVRMQ